MLSPFIYVITEKLKLFYWLSIFSLIFIDLSLLTL